MPKKQWTDNELDFLINNYQKYTYLEIANKLNRTPDSIQGRLIKLNLKKEKKLVCNVGIYEEGKYIAKINNKHTREYQTWRDMLKRCYDNKLEVYKECFVSKDWLIYQIFAEWYHKNYYEIPNEKITLDKDILVKNNKIYSPDTCIFIPSSLNSLFCKANSIRGKFPIGVTYRENYKQPYSAYVYSHKKRFHLGYYNTSKEAFNAYALEKKKIMFNSLCKYKEKLPLKIYNQLYDAFARYKIEITD